MATVEDQAKTDVSRANAEVREARRERDEAVKELHDIELQEKEWQRRVDEWKVAVSTLIGLRMTQLNRVVDREGGAHCMLCYGTS